MKKCLPRSGKGEIKFIRSFVDEDTSKDKINSTNVSFEE
jgi:hypothetical protein